MVITGNKNFPKLSHRPQVRENLPTRNEGKDEVDKPGVDTAADQLHYEGVLDGGEDLLLILHVFDLLVPDDVLQGQDLQGVVLLSLFVLTEQDTRKFSCVGQSLKKNSKTKFMLKLFNMGEYLKVYKFIR